MCRTCLVLSRPIWFSSELTLRDIVCFYVCSRFILCFLFTENDTTVYYVIDVVLSYGYERTLRGKTSQGKETLTGYIVVLGHVMCNLISIT